MEGDIHNYLLEKLKSFQSEHNLTPRYVVMHHDTWTNLMYTIQPTVDVKKYIADMTILRTNDIPLNEFQFVI